MTYRESESSSYDSAPIELFRFEGSFKSYFLTSSATEYTYLDERYIPAAGLDRSEVELAIHSEDQSNLDIRIPSASQIIKDYGFQDTPHDLDFTMYRIQRDTGEAIVYFRGAVSQIKISGETAEIIIPSKFREVLSNTVPTVFVQAPCNHILFDSRCKVNRGANTFDTKIIGVNDRSITVENSGPFDSDFFVGGELVIEVTGERRTIVAQAGALVQVNFEFNRISPDDSVTLAAGCDHGYKSAGGCPKFANQLNFGGFPFVPGQSNNVFSHGIEGS